MKDITALPTLKKMRFPIYRTFRRGVRIGINDITLRQSFTGVIVDQKKIERYKKFFGFFKEFPVTYLYILAQRAQLAVMLKKEFTISILGLIHLNNNLETLGELRLESPFDIEVDLKVESKPTGSLYPNFNVLFSQEGRLVAKCTSGYLRKRKNKNKSISSRIRKIRNENKEFLYSNHSDRWELTKSLGKSYGKVSGDLNPIHTSKLFAKLNGFDRPIIQGWYSASRVIEKAINLVSNVDRFKVTFNKPIYLPSLVQVNFQKIQEDNSSYVFSVTSPDHSITHLYGNINCNNNPQ